MEFKMLTTNNMNYFDDRRYGNPQSIQDPEDTVIQSIIPLSQPTTASCGSASASGRPTTSFSPRYGTYRNLQISIDCYRNRPIIDRCLTKSSQYWSISTVVISISIDIYSNHLNTDQYSNQSISLQVRMRGDLAQCEKKPVVRYSSFKEYGSYRTHHTKNCSYSRSSSASDLLPALFRVE